MKRTRNAKYRLNVRRQPCLICGAQADDAHHLRFAQDRGMGLKVSDHFCVPLCRGHHRENHTWGAEKTWWALHGVDPVAWAENNWKAFCDAAEREDET